MKTLKFFPGNRLLLHALVVGVVWFLLLQLNDNIDPLYSSYLALVAMYATAMFGMVILVGLSGQVSLGNGALMAVGGYVFALTSMNWQTVPLFGWEWNAIWSMVFAALGGILVGLIIGGLAARLRGPYLAGLTLGVAVGVPAIANRFPSLLGGENGLMLVTPYPAGGYAAVNSNDGTAVIVDEAGLDPTTGDSPGVGGEEDQFAELDFSDFEDQAGTTDTGSEVPLEDVPVDESAVAGDDLLTLDDLGGESGFDLAEPTGEESLDTGTDPATDTDLSTDPGIDLGFDGSGLEAAFDPTFIMERWQASVAIATAAIVAFAALNLVRGRQGSVWKAVRDDPVAAAVVGISPSGSKISAFVISSVFAALAGAVFAQILSFVGPGAFGLGLSLSLLVGIVLGGRSSLIGAIIGGVILVFLPEFVNSISSDGGWPEQVTNNAPNLLYGLLVVFVVLLAPGGLTGTIKSWYYKARGQERSPLG
jgi:ABC-type branched-subunit amino acid transport system permease subunit